MAGGTAATRRYQYTAIDDATRIRALRVYARHTQKNAIRFLDHVIEAFPYGAFQGKTPYEAFREKLG